MSDLKPGKYRMTVEVEVDEEGYLLPHDSGEMFMADWWTEQDAQFMSVEDWETVERGRQNQRAEHERLIRQVHELQAKVNSLTRLHDERDAIERGRLGVSGEDRSELTPAPREARVWREGDREPKGVTEVDGRRTSLRYRRESGGDTYGGRWLQEGGPTWFSWWALLATEDQVTEVVTLEGPA